jgi:hypothetical protein
MVDKRGDELLSTRNIEARPTIRQIPQLLCGICRKNEGRQMTKNSSNER